jgi:hypothetical protein
MLAGPVCVRSAATRFLADDRVTGRAARRGAMISWSGTKGKIFTNNLRLNKVYTSSHLRARNFTRSSREWLPPQTVSF